PESLSLADVVEPFDAARLARSCLLGEGPCSDETACAAHALWKTIAEPMRDFFRATTVADLVNQNVTTTVGDRLPMAADSTQELSAEIETPDAPTFACRGSPGGPNRRLLASGQAVHRPPGMM